MSPYYEHEAGLREAVENILIEFWEFNQTTRVAMPTPFGKTTAARKIIDLVRVVLA